MTKRPGKRPGSPLTAMFLGPFTHQSPNERGGINLIGEAVERALAASNVKVHRPWLDASANPRPDFGKVWRDDMRALWFSHVAVVLESPSLGNGVLLAWLHTFAIPTIVIRQFGVAKSPIAHGLPLMKLAELEFANPEDLERLLRLEIASALPLLTSARAAEVAVVRERTAQLGEMIRRQLKQHGWTRSHLAARTGLTEAWLEMLEEEEWAMWGVSFGEVKLIARALDCSEWNLLAPESLTGFTTDEFSVIEEAARRDNWRQREKDSFLLAFHTLWTQARGASLTVDYVRKQFDRWKRRLDGGQHGPTVTA